MRQETRSLGLIIAGSLALAGCMSPPGYTGIPTESITQRVTVYFGTDRAPTSREPNNVEFGNKRAYLTGSDPFQLGVCRIEIERGRNNELTAPLPKHGSSMVRLGSTTLLERQDFYGRLRDMMWNAGANELFVYVHGYNNSFEDAAIRTAELWYDLGFRGPPIFYSWPSKGGLLGYFSDGSTVQWTSANLKDFLLKLADQTSARRIGAREPARIHLIAHSMGCRPVLNALAMISDELASTDDPIFCDVILAAPDIDRDVLRDTLAPRLFKYPVAEHYTMYASSSDKALSWSQWLTDYPRAGTTAATTALRGRDDFVTIDVSSVQRKQRGMRHNYFISEPSVIRDMIEVLVNRNRRPNDRARHLVREDSSSVDSWVMVEPD